MSIGKLRRLYPGKKVSLLDARSMCWKAGCAETGIDGGLMTLILAK
jgi:hypothetical protein